MKNLPAPLLDWSVAAFLASTLFAVFTANRCSGQNLLSDISSPRSELSLSVDADGRVKVIKFATEQEFNSVISGLRNNPQVVKDVTMVLDVANDSLLIQGDPENVARINALLDEMAARRQVNGEMRREQANLQADNSLTPDALNKMLDLETTSRQLADELRSSATSATRRSDLEVELRQVLNDVFDAQQIARQAEYARFEARLIELKNRLVQREEERERIIAKRMETLLGGPADDTQRPASGTFKKYDPSAFQGQLLNLGVVSESSGAQCQISLMDPRSIDSGTILEISRPVKSNQQESFSRFGVLKVIRQIDNDTISAEIIESTRILNNNRWQWQLPQEGDHVTERHEIGDQ